MGIIIVIVYLTGLPRIFFFSLLLLLFILIGFLRIIFYLWLFFLKTEF
jgi:hypothetical protein